MRSIIKFNDNTLEQIYYAFYANEKRILSINDAQKSGTEKYNNEIKNSNTKLQAEIEAALGKDLYKRYLIATNQKKVLD